MAVTQFACISVNSAQFIGRRLSSAWHLPVGVQTSSRPASPFVSSGYFNGWGEPDLAIAHLGDNTVTVLARRIVRISYSQAVYLSLRLFPMTVHRLHDTARSLNE
jgi:hypothetical protein